MRTILFCSLALVFSLSAVAQQVYHGEYINNHDIVAASDAKPTSSEPSIYFCSNLSNDTHHYYGLATNDGDLESAYKATDTYKVFNDISSDPEVTISITPCGDFPPRLADTAAPVSLAGSAPIDPTDIYGSLRVDFTYKYGKLTKVEPINKTSYNIKFTAKAPIMSDGDAYYCFSWMYEGHGKAHYICAKAPK